MSHYYVVSWPLAAPPSQWTELPQTRGRFPRRLAPGLDGTPEWREYDSLDHPAWPLSIDLKRGNGGSDRETFPRPRDRGGRAMIAGLPPGTWFLIAASTLPAVILVVAAYLIHRDADIRGGGRDSNG